MTVYTMKVMESLTIWCFIVFFILNKQTSNHDNLIKSISSNTHLPFETYFQQRVIIQE